MLTPLAPAPTTVLLPPSLSGHCAVLSHHAYDPAARRPDAPLDEVATAREQVRTDFVAGVLDALVAANAGEVVDLRGLRGPDHVERSRTALAAGVPLVVGPTLPADAASGRSGSPSALLRARDGGYHPVDVHWHRVTARRPPTDRPDPDAAQPPLRCATLGAPGHQDAEADEGIVLRLGSREADFLALAEYYRLLQSLGLASSTARGAVIGTDLRAGTPFLAWADLAYPQVRTFSRSAEQGWRLRSLLERHDHEHGFRVAVAREAAAGGRLVEPVVNRECSRCPWWDACRTRLSPDDISLRIAKGALDVREVLTLRRLGVTTLRELMAADPAWLVPRYLPEVRHRPDAEQRLRTAVRRAQMLVTGEVLQRDSESAIEFPAAETEIDLDIETSADGRVYLWGFLLHRQAEEPRYLAFSRFADLDEAAEIGLAVEALGWLRSQVERGECRVYHYSGYEVAMIARLAAGSDDETLQWAAEYARIDFVDLLAVMGEHFFDASGLGLKQVARQAGFSWRDDEPGGLNSQLWFADAVHAPTPGDRAQARQRVLDYNEDDVSATAALRTWLRAQ